MRGLILHVYRAADRTDCSNGGVSARHDMLVLVGTKRHRDEHWVPLGQHAQVFSATEDAPAVVLVESAASGVYGPHLEPVEYVEAHNTAEYAGPMAGGNYAGSADSRFAELGRTVFGHDYLDVVPVHDRVESWESYRALSI